MGATGLETARVHVWEMKNGFRLQAGTRVPCRRGYVTSPTEDLLPYSSFALIESQSA
jgi:hypothetical protein